MRELPFLYRGIVTNNSDPDSQLRVKVKVPGVLGDIETNWARPCVPPGWPNLVVDHATQGALSTDGDHGHGSAGSHAHGGTSSGSHSHSNAGDHTHTFPVGAADSSVGVKAAEHLVSYPVPAVGTKVWIMFENGDPEHPVWMGTWR